MYRHVLRVCFTGCLLNAAAFAGELDKKVIEPPAEEKWQFKLSLPGWVPWLEGESGVNGLVSDVSLAPDVTVPRIDMVADVRGEAHKGRWSVLGEFFYMSLSDGLGTPTVVKKVDVQLDQLMGDLAVAYRLLEGRRGYLDVVVGVRYTNLFQQAVTQANAERIGATSTQLVDTVTDRLATAATARVEDVVSSGALRRLIASKLPAAPELGRPTTLPIAPLDGRLGEQVRAKVQAIIDARKAALAAAVQARAQAVGAAARAAAQQRVEVIKKDLSTRIARTLESSVETRVARTDDWWDPYIGLRGRYDLSDKYYLIGKADIGGFGVGSDLTRTAEVALGWHLTPNIYSEVGFRALSVDYEKGGLTYDMISYGPQATLGIAF